jgi:hypothetical protein
LPDRSFTAGLPRCNIRGGRCSSCPVLSAFARFIRHNDLALPKAEEAMTVPVGSGHRLGDLGEAAKGLAIPGEALFEDHDPLELAIPLAHQQSACLQANAVSGLGGPTVERSGAILFLARTKHPLDRLVETAEGVGLKPIGQHSHQQPVRQMSGRLAAQMGAPVAAQPIEILTLEARHNRVR